MIIINGKKFATTEEERIDSLFEEGGTLDFMPSKERKNEILFFTNEEKTKGFWKSKVYKNVYGKFSKVKNGYYFQFCTEELAFL